MSVRKPLNFRDLAERVAVPLRRGVLYRSDHLGALDDTDAREFAALGIRRVIDVRGVEDRVTAVCRVPDTRVHSLAIEPTVVQVISNLLDAGHAVTAEETVSHMQDTYRGFVRHNTHRFAQFFNHLLESDEPTVFHCTAGKDRTGFAAALVLGALGASHDEVMRDYLHTNERLAPIAIATATWKLPPPAAQVMYTVRPEFLQAAFEEIDARFGGMDAYLSEGLGLRERERRRLRALYLAHG